jgi:hypothetical protein
MAILYAVHFDDALEAEFRRESIEEAEADGYATVAGNDDVEFFVIFEEDMDSGSSTGVGRTVFDSRTPK